MVKKSVISIISHEEKEENRGSVTFQIVNLTNRIRKLSSHLELHRKDYVSQRGLRKWAEGCLLCPVHRLSPGEVLRNSAVLIWSGV